MKKKERFRMEADSRNILFLLVMLIVGAFAIIAYLAFAGNTPQIFTDIVNEYTAIDGSNKSAERNLFYIFSFAGIIAYCIYYFLEQKKFGNDFKLEKKSDENKSYLYVIVSLLVFSIVYYFVYSSINWLLLAGMLIALILSVKDKDLIILGTAALFITSYAVCGVYRIYVLLGGQKPISMTTVVLLSFIVELLILVFSKKNVKQTFIREIMLSQSFVPFTLLTYLASQYKYGEEYINIQIPYKVQILIGGLIILFVAEAIIKIRLKWNNASGLDEVVTYGLCIAIMAFNRYSGLGSILPTDLHHAFENIIGYSQIFEMGQKAFTEYIPVSGMYSILQGFFLYFFGDGKASFYYLTTNIFYLFVIALIVILLKKQLKAEWTLLISVILMVYDYNRIVFIVPVMLLLAYPKLIAKKNLWLKAWFLSSFLHGLYYPIYGAAVCAGFAPLGIWQIVSYIKNGELKKDVKTISFWIWWIICCIPVVCGIPMLLGTIKHMMAMGGQTIYADGITRFGQTIPDYFFPYIQLLPTRLIIYYLFSFMIVISLVWLSFVLCLRNGNVRMEGKRIKSENPEAALISLSFGIAMLVAFSFTVIRMDINSIYARSAGAVYAAFVMLIIIVSRYMCRNKNRFWVFGIAVFAIAAVMAGSFGSMESNSKMSAYYTVPENYIYVVDDQVERFGEGFVEQGVYDYVENTYNYVTNMNREDSYLGISGTFGQYYLCNLKGDSVMEAGTIKGYGAAQETVDLIRNNGTIVGAAISSINNYYLYYWLINSGEYVWNPELRIFVPNDGTVMLEDIQVQNKYIDMSAEGAGLGRTAGSWGNSIDTLYDIFSAPEVEYSLENIDSAVKVDFHRTINGNDADFMYIEFADQSQNYEYILFNHSEDVVQDTEQYWYIKNLMKKDYNRGKIVVFTWIDESGASHSMNCRMEQGKLLIPLGGGRGWLLNNHSDISITVMQGEEVIAVPEITKIEMLKLREVE